MEMVIVLVFIGIAGCQTNQFFNPIDLDELTIHEVHQAFEEGEIQLPGISNGLFGKEIWIRESFVRRPHAINSFEFEKMKTSALLRKSPSL